MLWGNWKGAWHLGAMEKACKHVNKELQVALEGALGCCLPHPRPRVQENDLYQADGVHLSSKDIDIFLEDIQWGLKDI